MGIDDRDYMRDRYRKRRALGGTRWNDKKGRSERDDDTPIGSASWIGKNDGLWFAEKNQGFDYQKNVSAHFIARCFRRQCGHHS
ncbi:hypothetical protein QUC32_26990 (plasmid) [Novosphingobium resinovorum]|uniref:hypothetical protein n=1 Tax=Novosphingobium sp. HR1a TaxID=1395637 RepID=UPI001B3C7D69|nr:MULTISPECIES: hypothetical protein [Novosphingobium]WJM30031.1 hypothetical protein QUC32_26990 [Novosphingobium resinovorum]